MVPVSVTGALRLSVSLKVGNDRIDGVLPTPVSERSEDPDRSREGSGSSPLAQTPASGGQIPRRQIEFFLRHLSQGTYNLGLPHDVALASSQLASSWICHRP
jgi:hypothetical protein